MASIDCSLSANCFIDETAATTNYGGIQIDVGEISGGTQKRRSLIKFDLSGIDSTAIFDTVTLKLYKDVSDLSSNTRTMRVYRVKRAWSQAGCTWNKYDGTNNWSTAGCGDTTNDRDGTDIGSISMPDVTSAGYKEITLTPSSVNDWINGGMTNNGMVVIMDTETDDMQRFDGPTPGYSNPPILSITYHLPESGGFYHMSV